MDASGAPVTDELTGVHHSPQRDAIYEPEKTARRKSTLRHRPPQCSDTSRTSAQLYSTMSDTAEPHRGFSLQKAAFPSSRVEAFPRLSLLKVLLHLILQKLA